MNAVAGDDGAQPRTQIDGYQPLLGALRAEGADPRAVLLEFGVDPDAPLVAPGAPDAAHVVVALVEAGLLRFGDGFLVRQAERSRLEDHQVLGYVCLTAADVGAALRLALRYRRIRFAADDFALVDDGDVVRLVRQDARLPAGHADASRAVVELGLGEHLAAMREVSGQHVRPVEVRLACAPPRDTSDHERFFDAPLVWRAARHELVLPASVLALACRHRHAGMQSFFEAEAQRLLAQAQDPAGVTRRVREVLAGSAKGEAPSLAQAARRLAMSERSLARRLQEEGTTFRAVLDEVRRDLAVSYLRSQRLSVAEVAFLLGFSEPSAFIRAFKRWTGRSPAQVRAAR